VALVSAVLLGVGLGSKADAGPYLPARYFDRRHFSVLYGLTWTAYAIGLGTGPVAHVELPASAPISLEE
jgi:hypothetical protein